jgi:hypothetical protein
MQEVQDVETIKEALTPSADYGPQSEISLSNVDAFLSGLNSWGETRKARARDRFRKEYRL